LSKSNSKDIILHEHDTWSHFEDSSEKIFRKQLKDEDVAVLDELKEKYGIRHSFDKNNSLVIESNQNIGSVQLPNLDHRINITPKMFKNKKDSLMDTSVFLFFANNINIKKFMKEQKNFFETDSEHLVHPLHIDLITKCEELLNKGLLKSYVVNTENISAVRGKLLFQQQMVNDLMRKPKFFCEYDELEYDSTENRVLLQAMTIVERTSKITYWKMKALDLAQKLSGVVNKVNVSKPERQMLMRSYNRQNSRYKEIHQTCERLIEQEGVGNIYSGERSVVPIFYNMNNEFERFVENLFLKYYEMPSWVKTQSSAISWNREIKGSRRMRPDIIIQDDDGNVKHIIDTKYKDHELTPGDLYQIGFYMHEYGKNNELDDAFAILPESYNVSDETYTSTKKKKNVHQRTLNVVECLEMIKENNEEGLRTLVSDLIKI
jgi:5-methylcytosine-specific restriction endonuclease McrBC regulatory subunit McrC